MGGVLSDFICPKCLSLNIAQARSLCGPIWCLDCGYKTSAEVDDLPGSLAPWWHEWTPQQESMLDLPCLTSSVDWKDHKATACLVSDTVLFGGAQHPGHTLHIETAAHPDYTGVNFLTLEQENRLRNWLITRHKTRVDKTAKKS